MERIPGAFLFLFVLLTGAAAWAGPEEEILITEALARGPVGQYERSAIHSDPVEHALATGSFVQPEEGEEWKKLSADKGGWFKDQSLRRGYLYCDVASPKERVMILEAAGQSLLYVNGTPRGGDVYGYGWIQHPVSLKKGRNDFLFRVSRGRVKAKLVKPRSPVMLTTRDMTLPDLVRGKEGWALGAIRVINALDEPVDDLEIRSELLGKNGFPMDEGTVTYQPAAVAPMTSRKVGFLIRHPALNEKGGAEVRLTLHRCGRGPRERLDSASIKINIRSSHEHHKQTFLSEIDGSVQYYALSPGRIREGERPALFLTCHGAGVEAAGQARVYAAKTWGHVVAPTNRRPYGFDWEDWGRLDAMEVLEIVMKRFDIDPQRTYLTGHSMGGHGAWYLGAAFPARWAAVGPSAGWYSFWSYGGKKRDKEETPIQELFARASNPSDVVALSRNFLHHGIYVLHGDKDDNVPVEQARYMRELLSEFHSDFAYYEKPGAGHWWGGKCCDWEPMFDFFRHHTIPENKNAGHVEFITPNPGISSASRWVSIEAQERHLRFSSVKIRQDVKGRILSGTTDNVARLALDLSHLDKGEPVTVELDDQKLEGLEAGKRLWLARIGGQWKTVRPPDPALKGPHRYGTFKDAFRHRVIFVYATNGTPEENAWAFDKARFDAETFWYRGNGSVDVVPDRDFNPAGDCDRSVILYGCADSNGAWGALLDRCPLEVRRDELILGKHALTGSDLGCYFVYPRPGSDVASVGVVAGTGLEGKRAANMNMYFIAGSGFPDVLVFGSDMLLNHFDGVRCVGYFGNDWSVEQGEFAFRD